MADKVWLTPSQRRTWLSYMGVYHRMEFEMNRQLQAECGLSLADYTVMNALSVAPGRRLRVSQLATNIGWERSRLSHHLQRTAGRFAAFKVADRFRYPSFEDDIDVFIGRQRHQHPPPEREAERREDEQAAVGLEIDAHRI